MEKLEDGIYIFDDEGVVSALRIDTSDSNENYPIQIIGSDDIFHWNDYQRWIDAGMKIIKKVY